VIAMLMVRETAPAKTGRFAAYAASAGDANP
jgi:hypothetical protein